MGLGRTVADAYINVHGDLSDFRRDLDQAGGAAAEKAAMDNADKFSKAWGDRIEQDVNDRWGKIVDAMYSDKRLDWDRLIGTFDPNGNLADAENRIKAFTDDMARSGKIGAEDQDRFNKALEGTLGLMGEENKAEKDRIQALKDAKDAQDRYNRSLDGMLAASHVRQTEEDFRRLNDAITSGDWSKIANGSKDMESFRTSVNRTATDMHSLGRISDDELARLGATLHNVSRSADAFGISFKAAATTGEGFHLNLGKINSALAVAIPLTQGLREHLGGFAGLNVFGDLVKEGLDFIHNLDRISLAVAQTALMTGTKFAAMGSAMGQLVVVASDVANAFGGISALLPAFATGLGLMGFVAVTALGGFAEKYKKQIKAFKEDMLSEVMAGLDPALHMFENQTLPTLKKGLIDTSAAMGRLFGTVLDSITKSVSNENMTLMFKRMNDAMDKSRAGVASFIDAWAVLGLNGTKYFDRFAESINAVSARFDTFVKAAAADGRLDAWIETGIKGFKDLGRVVDGTFGVFNAVATAARAAGYGGLSIFADRLQGAAAVMQSPAFQKTLKTLFEGMASTVNQVGQAIGRLGPALAGIMPFVKQGFEDIGQAASIMIGYIGQIINDPAIHLAIMNFSGAIVTAMEKLGPAVAPFTRDLAHAITLLGQILPNIAEVVAAFEILISPTLDQVSNKLGTLITPLKDLVIQVLEGLKPAFELLVKVGINPMIDGIREKLIPDLGKAIKAMQPLVDAVVIALGPALGILATDILPGVVKIAGDLAPYVTTIVKLATPFIKEFFEGLGKSIQDIAKNMDDFNTKADPFLKHVQDIADKAGTINVPKTTSTGEAVNPFAALVIQYDLALVQLSPKAALMAKFFNPYLIGFTDSWNALVTGVKNIFNSTVLRDNIISGLTKALTFGAELPGVSGLIHSLGIIAQNIGKAWDTMVKTVPILLDPKKLSTAISEGLGKLVNGLSAISVPGVLPAIAKIFTDMLFKPLQDAWDGMWKGLDGWWKDRKRDFQTFMKEKFNLGTIFKDNAHVTNGGGIGGGGKGMGVGGKIDVADTFGLPTGEDILKYCTDLAKSMGEGAGNIVQGFLDGFTNHPFVKDVTENFTKWVQPVLDFFGIHSPSTLMFDMAGNIVQGFIDGFGQLLAKVSEIWNGISTWITTKIGEIGTNIAGFITTVQTNWNAFWDGVNQKVTEIWNAVTGWIGTKVTEISTTISGFVTTVQTNWNTFWDSVNTKVVEIWNAVTSWIGTKVTEIRGNIDGFIGGVRTNWENFWNGVNQTVVNIWNAVTGWINQKVGEIRGAIDGFIGGVRTNWDNFWNTVKNKVTEAWDNISRGVQNGINDALRWLGGLPQRAVDAVGDVGGKLLQKGKDFAQGFINGIGSMVGGIAKAAADFVGAAIEAARGAQDSNSPSKVTAGLGRDFGDGFTLGIGRTVTNVVNAAETLVGSAVDAVTANFAKSKMYIAGSEAALGLAQGLSDNKALVADAFASLTPDTSMAATVNTTGGAGTMAGATTIVKVEAGAMPITTPTQDPALVAAKVIDGFASLSNA